MVMTEVSLKVSYMYLSADIIALLWNSANEEYWIKSYNGICYPIMIYKFLLPLGI